MLTTHTAATARPSITQRGTPITPLDYFRAGYNVRPANPLYPQSFQKGCTRTATMTEANFIGASVGIVFTGKQPNGNNLLTLDCDDTGVMLERIKRERPELYKRLTSCYSTSGLNRWAYVYTNSPVVSQEIKTQAGTIEVKAEQRHVNLPKTREQIIHGDIFNLSTLNTVDTHELLTLIGYEHQPAPALEARGAATFTGDDNPIKRYNLENTTRLLDEKQCRNAQGNTMHCGCGKHKNNDATPSLAVIASSKYGVLIFASSPACDFYNSGKPISAFDLDRKAEGLTVTEKLKQVNPIKRSDSPQATQKREKRTIERDARLQQYTDRLAEDITLPRRARELAALLLNYGTMQVTASNAELIQQLAWQDETNKNGQAAAERMVRRAFEVLKDRKYGNRSYGTNIPVVRLPIWTWGNQAKDVLRRTNKKAINVLQAVENEEQMSALKVYKNTTEEKGTRTEKGKEKVIAGLTVYRAFDDNPSGEWASFDPSRAGIDCSPLKPHEMPSWLRRRELVTFGMIAVDETAAEPQHEQVVIELPKVKELTKEQKEIKRLRTKLEAMATSHNGRGQLAAELGKARNTANKYGTEWAKRHVRVIERFIADYDAQQPKGNDLFSSLFCSEVISVDMPQVTQEAVQVLTLTDEPTTHAEQHSTPYSAPVQRTQADLARSIMALLKDAPTAERYAHVWRAMRLPWLEQKEAELLTAQGYQANPLELTHAA